MSYEPGDEVLFYYQPDDIFYPAKVLARYEYNAGTGREYCLAVDFGFARYFQRNAYAHKNEVFPPNIKDIP